MIDPIEFRKIQEGIANFLKYSDEIAKMSKAFFNSYKKQGFTDEQALKLCSDMTRSIIKGEG